MTASARFSSLAGLFDATSEAANGGWIQVTPDMRVSHLSPGAARLFGVSPSEAVGAPCMSVVGCTRCVCVPTEDQAAVHQDHIDVQGVEGSTRVRRLSFAASADGARVEVFLPESPQPTANSAAPKPVAAFRTRNPRMQDELARAALLVAHDTALTIEGPCAVERLAFLRAAYGAAPDDVTIARFSAPILFQAAIRRAAEAPSFHVIESFLPQLRDGGVLMLEDVDSLDLGMQSIVLDTMLAGPMRRSTGAWLRFVLGIRRPLDALVKAGRVRVQLGTVLRPTCVSVTPLHERPEDIPLRVDDALQRAARNGLIPSISPEALDALVCYPWPGESAEVETTVRAACALSRGETVELDHLPNYLRGEAVRPGRDALPAPTQSTDRIRAAIDAAGGNLALAAERLGVSRATLWRWRRRLDLG